MVSKLKANIKTWLVGKTVAIWFDIKKPRLWNVL